MTRNGAQNKFFDAPHSRHWRNSRLVFLLSVYRECEQDIARHASAPRVTGIHKQHPTSDRSPRTIQGTAAGRNAVYRFIRPNRVEVPYNSAIGRGVTAEVTILRTRERDAWNCAHGSRLRGTAPFLVTAFRRRRVPDSLAAIQTKGKHTSARFRIGIRARTVRKRDTTDVRQRDGDIRLVRGRAPLNAPKSPALSDTRRPQNCAFAIRIDSVNDTGFLSCHQRSPAIG